MSNNYWDKTAIKYDSHTNKSQKMYDNLISLLKTELTLDNKVLDLGTGTGEIPVILCNNCKEFHGVDKSEAMIAIAKNKVINNNISNVSFSIQDSYNLEIDDKKYDVVIIANLLHIVENPKKVIEEAGRVLKDDGKLIVATYLHGYSVKTKMISFVLAMMGHPIYTRFNSKSMYVLLKESVFEPVRQELIDNIIPVSFLVSKKEK